MITSTDKFIVSLFIALFLGVFSSIFFQIAKLPQLLIPMIELLLLATPFFFLYTYSTDAVFGFVSASTYKITQGIILYYSFAQSFSLFSILLFSIAFFFFILAVAFQREQTLKNVSLSLLGVVAIIFTFFFSSFLLITYEYYFEPTLSIKLPKLPEPVEQIFEFFSKITTSLQAS